APRMPSIDRTVPVLERASMVFSFYPVDSSDRGQGFRSLLGGGLQTAWNPPDGRLISGKPCFPKAGRPAKPWEASQ
ncbi:hypothetical protein, partial [Streptosporangium minutum]|uniref:hypothetical protein n=1 Tax=Streptosporangium minutum TaxID=569862 RepID=UPI001A99D9B3